MRQSKRMKFAKFYDDVTGKLLPGHLFRAARQDEVKFLNTFPVYKKAPEANAEGKERVSVWWRLDPCTGQTFTVETRMSVWTKPVRVAASS